MGRAKIKSTGILVLCLFMTACASNKPADNLARELDSLLSAEFRGDEPGGCVLIKKGEKTVFLRSYGLADLETKEKITENTLFNLGSISKTFVSNGILILQENRLLSVEDSLSKYFNDFKNREIADRVRIKHLLSHTSGLPDNRKVDDNFEFFLTAKDEENFAPIKQADSLNFNPGEKFEYSNPAFNGLALIIEKVSGQPWQKFIKDSIFIQSGMVESKITDGPYPYESVAHGYELENGKYVESDYGEYPTFAAAGNGGIWSSVTELAKYEEAIRQNVFLGKELTDISRMVYRPENWSDSTGPFIGYSWYIGNEQMLGEENKFGVNFIYHKGDQGGFRAFYVVIPEKDILYIGLFNRPPEDLDKIIKEGIYLFERNKWLD
jgi:CubicO group peptidase (beta-lactamase class C family)